jgi:hypothetical protein
VAGEGRGDPSGSCAAAAPARDPPASGQRSICRSALLLTLGSIHMFTIIVMMASFPCQKQSASADELNVKAVIILHLVGLSRSKQTPIKNGRGFADL